MKLVLMIGSGAVGKMTVGQALTERTELRLFHNHMTIEPVLEVFGKKENQVIGRLRRVIFEEFAKSDHYGLIFTYMWAFDQPSDWAEVQEIVSLFEQHGAEIYCVELVASQAVRLQRNKTENRMRHKASKRDIAFSESCILREDASFRLVSREGELPFANYLRIDNTHLTPEQAAEQIQQYFQL